MSDGNGNGDRRSVATDALATLGTIIDDTQRRDAIHLAVEPVVAGELLYPGDHVKVVDGVAWEVPRAEATGIVDPFLADYVLKGQRFWFVMCPRMVHSLRHVWTHPAFPDEPGTPAPVAEGKLSVTSKIESEQWLRRFCLESDCPGYDAVMELLEIGSLPGGEEYGNSTYDEDGIIFRGQNAHAEIPEEFWSHAETVLGRRLEYRPQYFSCVC